MFEKRKPDQPAVAATEAEPAPAPETRTMPSSPRNASKIGASIKIKGDIEGAENLVVEGALEGNVRLPDHDLTIGENGTVTSKLEAKTVKVDGTVNGDISATDLVVVTQNGNVRGNITAPRVTLEDGAKFKGSIDMDPATTTKASPKKEPAAEFEPPRSEASAQAGG